MKKYFDLLLRAIRGDEKEFTSGSIRRAIFMLSIPMILEMAMESLFAVVDIFFVSKVGVNAVATVGLTESVLTLVYSVAIGLSMAATAMVARRIGEKKPEKAAEAAMQCIILAVSISLIISVTGFILAEEILEVMGATPEIIQEGRWYTKIMFASNIVIMLIFLLNAIFRGAGDASIAMRTLWLSNFLNIFLDPCLIFGLGPFPELGLTGAAVATTIGRGCGVLFQLYHLFNGKNLVKLGVRHFRIMLDVIWRLLKVSLGGVGQYILASASWIFLMRFMSTFGEEALAGYTIAIRLIIFTILPAWGLANSAATLVGQNLGAEQPDRAEKSVWLTSFYTMLFMAFVAVLYFIFAKPLMQFFNSNPDVVGNGMVCLKIVCSGYVFFAYGMVISQSFNGAGDTYTPTGLNFLCFWLLQIPLAYSMGILWDWGPSGIYWAIFISESVLAILAILVFKRGKWKLQEI